jgi:hypothetical protein
MAKFFEECVRLKKRRRSAEMYHWCANSGTGIQVPCLRPICGSGSAEGRRTDTVVRIDFSIKTTVPAVNDYAGVTRATLDDRIPSSWVIRVQGGKAEFHAWLLRIWVYHRVSGSDMPLGIGRGSGSDAN